MSTICAADLVTWEVQYNDGTVDRESDGTRYIAIDRNKLTEFRLVSPDGVVLFATYPPVGMSGQNFVYRRRISMPNGQRVAVFILGWIPVGPVFAIDVEGGTYRVLEGGFDPTDADLYPPVPMPGEGYFESLGVK